MPIYEYQCGACGALHEALQKVSDEPLVDCPACGQPALRKKVSAVAFRLKGSGWYETDFKSGNKKNLAENPGEGGANSEGGDTKGDAGKDEGATAKGEASGDKKSAAGRGAKDTKPASGQSGGGDSAA